MTTSIGKKMNLEPSPPPLPFQSHAFAVLEQLAAPRLVRVSMREASGGYVIEHSALDGSDVGTIEAAWWSARQYDDAWCAIDCSWRLLFGDTLVAAALRVRPLLVDPDQLPLALLLLVEAEEQLTAGEPPPARVHESPSQVALTDRVENRIAVTDTLFQIGRGQRMADGPSAVNVLLLRAALNTQHILFRDSMRCAVTRNELGLVLRNEGRHDEALALFADAHAYFLAHHPPEHPDRATTLHNHGATLLLLGRTQEAEAELRSALVLHRRFEKTPLRDQVNTLWLLSEAVQANGDPARAIGLLERSLELRGRHGLGDELVAAAIAGQLADWLAAAGEPLRAIDHAKRRFHIVDQQLLPSDKRVHWAAGRLVQLWEAAGFTEDAAALRQRFAPYAPASGQPPAP